MATTDLVARVKLEPRAGDAELPKLAQVLGPLGVNPVAVKHACDEATAHLRGLTARAVLTVQADGSFDLQVLAPATSALLRQAAGVARGSGRPNTDPVGRLTREQLTEIARVKLPELTTTDLAAAERIVAGTARSMGLSIVDGDG